MYKNIEILNKKKFKAMKFTDVKDIEVAKNIGIIPIDFTEVIDMSCYAPVIIYGKKNLEFVAFTGVSKDITIFNNEYTYIPQFVKTYPFLNTVVKNKENELQNVISIDNGDNVSKRKKISIFTKNGELDNKALLKIDILNEFSKKREISKKIINEFKENDLLIKKDFKIKYNEEEKTIIETFYVVNREKLVNLNDDVLALWAKKGWMSIIDCHIRSLSKFDNVLKSTK